MCRDCREFIRKGDNLLDLGCGSAIAGKEFEKYFGIKVFGLDIADKRVEQIPFQIFNGRDIPCEDDRFDCTLISYVLHHSREPLALLKEAKRVTKGKVLVYEDVPENFLARIFSGLHGLSFALFFQKNEEKGVFKKAREWKDIFKNLGFKKVFEKKVNSNFDPVEKRLFVLEK